MDAPTRIAAYVLAFALLSAVDGRVARADEPAVHSTAGALLDEGLGLMIAHDYAAACPRIAESLALEDTHAGEGALRMCYERLQEAERHGKTTRVAGATIGGVGVAALVAGVVMAILEESAKSGAVQQCGANSGICGSSARSDIATSDALGVAAIGSLISGAVLTGVGAVVYLSAPKAGGPTVGIAPSGVGTSLSLTVRF